MSVEVLDKLSYFKNVIGVKNVSNDISTLTEISKLIKPGFDLFCGNDYLLIPSIALGAKSIISVIGNAYPEEIKKICNNFYENPLESRLLFYRVMPMMKNLKKEEMPSVIKYILYIMGVNKSKVRRPVAGCSNLTKRKIEEDYFNF